MLLWRFFFQEILRKHKSCLISCFAFTYGNIGSLVSKVGTQNIWPKSSMLKEKYCTLSIDIVPSHQNLGIILEIKCFKIWSYQKFDRKSVLMKLLNKKNLKALDTFWQRKLTSKVRFRHLLTHWHYVYWQKTIISFEEVEFWLKISLILYLFLWNLTTHITTDFMLHAMFHNCRVPWPRPSKSSSLHSYIKKNLAINVTFFWPCHIKLFRKFNAHWNDTSLLKPVQNWIFRLEFHCDL